MDINPLSEVNSIEVLFNKLNNELILEKVQLRNARKEIMELKIKTNELECSLNVKTKKLASIQDNINLKEQFCNKMEKQNIILENENKSMKLQLKILESTNLQLKKLIQSVELEKNEISKKYSTVKADLDQRQKFQTELVANSSNIDRTISDLQIKLSDFKKAYDEFVKNDSDVTDETLLNSNVAIQAMLDKTLEERIFFQERYCYYKALSEQLQNCIDNNNTHENLQFFYDKWKQNCDNSNQIIEVFTEHNTIIEDILKHKNNATS